MALTQSPHEQYQCGPTYGNARPEHLPDPTGQKLSAVCTRFLENMKMRFGAHSRQSAMIHTVLGEFRRGLLSKRETLTTIEESLGDHVDLKRDLMDILGHPDSRWGTGDFDFKKQSHEAQLIVEESLPLVQPPKKPLIHLPPLSTPWLPMNQGATSHGQSAHTASGSYGSYEHMDKSGNPFAQIQDQGENGIAPPESPPSLVQQRVFNSFQNLESPRAPNQINHGPIDMTYTFNNNEPSLYHHNESRLDQIPRFQDPWHNISNIHGWELEPTHIPNHIHPSFASSPRTFLPNHSDNLSAFLHSPRDSKHVFAEYNASVWQGTNTTPRAGLYDTDTSIQRFWHPPSNLESCDAMAPPHPRKSDHLSRDKHDPIESDDGRPQNQICDIPPTDDTKHKGRDLNKPRADAKSFIHGLCGKAFASRSKVKKHHWGNKNDDMNTTTGCWAKHKKPDVHWDDHVSCKEATPRLSINKRNSVAGIPKQGQAMPSSIERKAPLVPAMVPICGEMTTEIPTLQHLPRLVATAIEPLHLSTKTIERGAIPYAASRTPSRASMEDLLTVVNAEVSMIQSPQPQSRNNSIVSNLNAQAAGTERDGQMPHERACLGFHIPDYAASTDYSGRLHGEREQILQYRSQLPNTFTSSSYVGGSSHASPNISAAEVRSDRGTSPISTTLREDGTMGHDYSVPKRPQETMDRQSLSPGSGRESKRPRV